MSSHGHGSCLSRTVMLAVLLLISACATAET